MNSYIVISSSLNPSSKSRLLAKEVERILKERGVSVQFLDLEQIPLPFCDAGAAYRDATTQEVTAMIEKVQGIFVAAPVYNYNTNAALKNLIELTGEAWSKKIVSFMVSAGGHSSYMALIPTITSLMLDFRSYIVPRYVYASKQDFDEKTISNPDVLERLTQLVDETLFMTSHLHPSS